jgi:hypothetical protein
MDIKILSIHEQGNADKEYVFIEVLNDCNLKYYGLADTTYSTPTSISNKLRHFYWWTSHDVKKGERVVLRTGKGKNDSYVNNAGHTVHRFFWGLGSAVWNDTGDAAVLFNMRTWNTTKAN